MVPKSVIDDWEFDGDLIMDHLHLSLTTKQCEIYQEVEVISENDIEKTEYSKLFHNACDICGDIKINRRKLAYHILSHLGTMPYFCIPCNFSCISKLRLQQHIYNHGSHKSDNQRYWLFTKSNLHECELCDKTFSTWMSLVFHYSNHIISMPYKCQKCFLYFSDMKDFIIHSHLHKRTAVCEICDIFFDSKLRLLDHVLEHNKSKMFRKFRHIAWNDGLSSIRNPLSVLRADYFGNSFHRVFYDKICAEIDNDSFIPHDSTVDMHKTCANAELEYENREDVTHLCEIVFKEYSDNDSCVTEFNNVFNQHIKSTLSDDQSKSPINSKIKKYTENIQVKKNLSGKQDSISKLDSTEYDKKDSRSVVESQFKNKENYTAEFTIKKLSIKLEKLPNYVYDMKSFRRYKQLKRLRTKNTRQRLKNKCNKNDKITDSKLSTENKKFNFKMNNSLTEHSIFAGTTRKGKYNLYLQRRKLNIKTGDIVANKRILRSGKIVNLREIKVNDSESRNQKKEKELNTKKSEKAFIDKKQLCSKQVVKRKNECTVSNVEIKKHGKLENIYPCKKDNLKFVINSEKSIALNGKNVWRSSVASQSCESINKRKFDLKCYENFLEIEKFLGDINKCGKKKFLVVKNLVSTLKGNDISSQNLTEDSVQPNHFRKTNIFSKTINMFKTSYNFWDDLISYQRSVINSELSKVNHDHNYQMICNEHISASTTNGIHRKTKRQKNQALSTLQECDRNQNRINKKRRVQNICFKPNLPNNSSENLIAKLKSRKLSINLVRLPNYIYEKHVKGKPIMLSCVSPIISSVETLSTVPTSLTEPNIHPLLDHNYSDCLPSILDDHNYCKLHNDNDSESTLSSFSVTL